MKIDSIKDGIVLDHIKAGKSMDIYRYLGLDQLDCSVAIIKNVPSNKMGKKDILKIADNFDINLDVLGYVDPDITVCYIKDYEIVEKRHVELPEKRKTPPRTPFAETGLGQETTFVKPVPNEEERVFFHEDMEHCAAIVNPKINTRMTITWSDTLPILSHWRSMASSDYVCGLEPSNTYIMGRVNERANGTLPTLAPFESVSTAVTIKFSEAK